jgi:hypothetical protein
MSVKLEAGQWYRRKSGALCWCVGRTAAESPAWMVQVNRAGAIHAFMADGRTCDCRGDDIVARLSDCTGWDWQERKSLGQKLAVAMTIPGVCEYEVIAEVFLRDALKPPDGKTLGWLFAKHAGTDRNMEYSAREFFWELTGLEFYAEATP